MAIRVVAGSLVALAGLLVPLLAWPHADRKVCGEVGLEYTGPGRHLALRSAEAAIVVPVRVIERDAPVETCGGPEPGQRELTVWVTADHNEENFDEKLLFVGVAAPDASAAYLTDVRRDRIRLLPKDVLGRTWRPRVEGTRAAALGPPSSFEDWRARGMDDGAGYDGLSHRYDTGTPLLVVIVNRNGSRRVAADTAIGVEAVGPKSRPRPELWAFAVGVFLVVQGVAIARGRFSGRREQELTRRASALHERRRPAAADQAAGSGLAPT